MLVLVCYDFSTVTPEGRRRLSRVARCCLDYGQRVQNSVFECKVDPGQWAALGGRLLDEFETSTDSLRFYFLGSGRRRKLEHHGAKPAVDLAGPLIV